MNIEWLMIADAAEVVGNKLYVMGGGWDKLSVGGDFPTSRQIGIAVSFTVPWSETNERHEFELEVATEDFQTLHKANGGLEVGRPAGATPGSDQRVQIAANANLTFNKPGQYVVIARLDGQETRTVTLHVVKSDSATRPPQ